MFNLKNIIGILSVTVAILCVSATSLEAGHCRGYRCNRNVVSVNMSPTYVASSPAYVVERSYYQPVYAVPAQPVVVYQAPVYVAPQPRVFSGFSFNWFFR
jgi:hypothetical protein